MSNIHLYIIGSKIFSDLLKELNSSYKISQDKDFMHSNQNFLVRIIFVERLKLVEIKKYIIENIPTIFLLNDKNFLKKK